MISLPIAFLSLIPSGTVSPTLFDVIDVVRRALPLRPGAAGDERGARRRRAGVGLAIVHLAVLAVAYGALARVAIRRFV